MAINPFRIGELQLPQPVRPVPLDFSGLKDIGADIGRYRRQQDIGSILAGATDASGNLDVMRAATKLGEGGYIKEADDLFQNAIRQQSLVQTGAHQKVTEQRLQEAADLAKKQYESSINPELQKTLAEAKRGETLHNVAPGTTVVDKAGKPIYTAPVPEGSVFDAETIAALARQARTGDTSVFAHVGRGVQGPQNLVALRQEMARQNVAEGVTPEEQAAKNAEFFGQKAGQRTLGTRQANIEQAVTEAQQLAPLVLEASNKVDRTRFPLLNSVILAAERGTGDENVVRLGVAINSMVNVYARAINPSGVPTVSDKEHARELLQAAWGKGQINAAIDQLQKEMTAARASPGMVREQMREGITGKKTEKPQEQPQTTAPKPIMDKVKNADEANALIAEAEAFVAANPNASRDAVYKRLIDRDVPPAVAARILGAR